jgi:HNH endonuclease
LQTRSVAEVLESIFLCADQNGPVPQHRPDLGKCWEWGRVKGRERKPDAQGYSYVSLSRKRTTGHRFVAKYKMGYELTSDDVVMHLCDNRICVNPAHLCVTTQMGNVADKVSKNRQCKGSAVGRKKLVEADIPKIWDAFKRGRQLKSIAAELNVDPTTLSYVTRKKTWVPETEKWESQSGWVWNYGIKMWSRPQ